jgi:hypothetical protein
MRRLLPLLLLLPAACAQQPPGPEAALEDALATHAASQASLGRPLSSASGVSPISPAPAGGVGGGATPAQAAELVGQPPEALRRMLGEPRLRRAEGPAEVWHYQTSACHLDLVLYREDGAAAGLRVAFAQARASGTARRAEAACLREIARGAAQRPPAGTTDVPAAGA